MANRCLAFHQVSGWVELQSRQQKSLTASFPEIVAAVAGQVPAGTVLDRELVMYRGGRCDFAGLQQHLSSRARSGPVTFVAFDLLAVAGRDLRGLPYRTRRKWLRRLLAKASAPRATRPPPPICLPIDDLDWARSLGQPDQVWRYDRERDQASRRPEQACGPRLGGLGVSEIS